MKTSLIIVHRTMDLGISAKLIIAWHCNKLRLIWSGKLVNAASGLHEP